MLRSSERSSDDGRHEDIVAMGVDDRVNGRRDVTVRLHIGQRVATSYELSW